jgi:cystathionine beta-synthase
VTVVGPKENILAVVGNTPVVKLGRVSGDVQAAVYVKLEFMNPGGSVKDRIALHLVSEAEESGRLKKGGTIIEPTSGNTGMALAMLAAVRGYKTIFTMPDKVSEEKRSLLRALGAEVILTPTSVSPDSPQHYVNVARRLSEEIEGAYMPNQYANGGNPEAHYRSTGPEIWEQMEGRIDAFAACIGTGGTISGTGRYLKEKKSSIAVVGVEPLGSIYYNRKYGTDYPLHPYLVEGIGEDFVPTTYDPGVVDEIVRVSDSQSFSMSRRLAREEGILAGGSSGAAVVGALEFLKHRDDIKNIVVILPDTGRSYLSKFYSDEWMKSRGLV